MMTNRIIVDQDKCTGCNICSKICPIGVVDPADENHLPEVKEQKPQAAWTADIVKYSVHPGP